jgi:hypothetical protein
VVTITPAQPGYLLEGIDWRLPRRTWGPQAADRRALYQFYSAEE